jgi:hypothetical protein
MFWHNIDGAARMFWHNIGGGARMFWHKIYRCSTDILAGYFSVFYGYLV